MPPVVAEPEISLVKPARKRWCTDICCILLYVLCAIGSVAICTECIKRNPSLLTNLQHPADSYGNNCGRGSLYNKSKVIFPRLDEDFAEQQVVVSTGQWWDFKPTKVCAEGCPDGFDLNNPEVYGGVGYPCTERVGNSTASCGTVPAYYYVFITRDVVDYCMPLGKTLSSGTRDLCVTPDCRSSAAIGLNSTFPGAVVCASVEAQPDAQTTWAICSPASHCEPGTECCTQQKALCSAANGGLTVQEAKGSTFTPSQASDTSTTYTDLFTTYIKIVLGGFAGLIVQDGLIAMTLFGVALPIIAGFAWAIFLWFFAGTVVYLLILVLVAALGLLDLALVVKAGWFTIDASALSAVDLIYNVTQILTPSELDATEKKYFQALAAIALVVTAIVVIFIVLHQKAIKRLIAILKECTKIFKSMFFIIFWPFWDLALQAGVFVYGFLSIYFTANAPSDLFSDTRITIAAVIYQLFFYFFSSQLVRVTVWTSMSAAICHWYVTQVSNGKKCCGLGTGILELFGATWLVCSKHLGSMVFGALIIAIVQTIRAVVLAIDRQTQDLQKKNKLLKLGIKCLQCCLACVQKTIEFISYYGFIFVAMRGDSFCKACFATMKFVIQYAAQTAVNKTVTLLLTLLIGISTPLLSAVLTLGYLEFVAVDYASRYSTQWTAGVVFIIAYIVTSGVTMVYDCAINTIYLCAFRDLEENSGNPKYMSNDLREGFGLDKAHEEASLKSQTHKTQTQIRQEKSEVTVRPAEAPRTESPSPRAQIKPTGEVNRL